MNLVIYDFFNGNTLKTDPKSNKTQRTNKKPQNITQTEIKESIIVDLFSDKILCQLKNTCFFHCRDGMILCDLAKAKR